MNFNDMILWAQNCSDNTA